MSSLDFDLDMTMSRLEREWRQAYECSVVARSDYQILAASAEVNSGLVAWRVNEWNVPRRRRRGYWPRWNASKTTCSAGIDPVSISARVADALIPACCQGDSERAAESLERQWFAASSAANTLKAECNVLLGVLEITGDAWRRACAQLAQVEAIRDALEGRLANMDALQSQAGETVAAYAVMSAA